MFPAGFRHNYSQIRVPYVPVGKIIRTIILILILLFGPLLVIRAAEAEFIGTTSSEMLPTSTQPGYYGYHGLMSST